MVHKSSNQHRLIQAVVFSALNALLLARHGDAVPKRDLLACVVGVIGCLLALNLKKEEFVLDRTWWFSTLFAMITMSEVFFTLILPWLHIFFGAPVSGFLLGPHLFVFQAQIALEGLFMGEGNSLLVYYFTVVANLWRGLALATWFSRTNVDERDDLPLILKLLPPIAICLWVCSNLFICFEWYPCIRIQRVEALSTNKKKE
jgi:hypothetical protein